MRIDIRSSKTKIQYMADRPEYDDERRLSPAHDHVGRRHQARSRSIATNRMEGKAFGTEGWGNWSDLDSFRRSTDYILKHISIQSLQLLHPKRHQLKPRLLEPIIYGPY